jgi:flagellar hook protein FlgE
VVSVRQQPGGNVIVNYNNGQTRTIALAPLELFNAPDTLQEQNGQSFTATTNSGMPLVDTNGAGTEFFQPIVAQQAWPANAKGIATANDMLESTIEMKQ